MNLSKEEIDLILKLLELSEQIETTTKYGESEFRYIPSIVGKNRHQLIKMLFNHLNLEYK